MNTKNRPSGFATRREVWAAVAAHPEILKAGPRVGLFLLRYIGKFRVRRAGRHLVLHSHLPPLNHPAYGRFIREHLLGKIPGPSHAQIGLTNACPQRCGYCYNRDRRGEPMSKAHILAAIRDLRDLGVFWLGLTGGEPLLNKDIVEITAAASPGMAVKLFTTGLGLTPELAASLRDAGLFSVSISLDHWREDVHDAGRGYPGAFRAALRAIETARAAGGLHVGVSAVLSPAMIRDGEAEAFLAFLAGLGLDEAWLCETKPSGPAFWRPDAVASDSERRSLIALQDRWNRGRGLTVNYLGHFESGRHFGCNAGRKMVYVDAFGEVSPCVFTPMSFGNVKKAPLPQIVGAMSRRFRPSNRCFMNTHYPLFRDRAAAGLPLGPADSAVLVDSAAFGRPAKFIKILGLGSSAPGGRE
jgi:MoaA/NifB/PqqE/SkfB family radical SAM enzyme